MERKEVHALLLNDFENFLKQNNLYQEFIDGNLKCSVCGKEITSENIALIYFSNGYKFCCDNDNCLRSR
jgi:hypothetical protein